MVVLGYLYLNQKNISINSNRNQAEDIITSFFYPLHKPVSYPNSSQESLFVRGVATEV